MIEHDGNESPHIMFYCDVSAEKRQKAIGVSTSPIMKQPLVHTGISKFFLG